MASALGDRYLRVGTPRPVREYVAGEALSAAGVPTPRVVAAAVYPAGPLFYRGDLVTEWVPASRDLAHVLFPPGTPAAGHASAADARAGDDDAGEARPGDAQPGAEARAAMEATGRLLRRAHDRGLDHPDLNLKNILIVDGGTGVEAMVLDLDGAHVRGRGGRPVPVRERRRRRMIARFWRSARKWERRTGRRLPDALRRAFESGYAAGEG